MMMVMIIPSTNSDNNNNGNDNNNCYYWSIHRKSSIRYEKVNYFRKSSLNSNWCPCQTPPKKVHFDLLFEYRQGVNSLGFGRQRSFTGEYSFFKHIAKCGKKNNSISLLFDLLVVCDKYTVALPAGYGSWRIPIPSDSGLQFPDRGPRGALVVWHSFVLPQHGPVKSGSCKYGATSVPGSLLFPAWGGKKRDLGTSSSMTI